jgi:membrane protease YdiL (CAAX protease family)
VTDSTTNPQLPAVTVPAPPPAPSTPAAPLRGTDLFFGPEGLRAGWGLLLFVVIERLLLRAGHALMRPAMHRVEHTVWHELGRMIMLAVVVVLTTAIMSRMEQRPFAAYGLPWRQASARNFAGGALWGFTALSFLLLALRGLHAFYFGALALHGVRALKFALFWAAFFFLVGIAEEGIFRGYAQFTLARGIGFWPAAVLLSALFASAHLDNPGENRIGILSVALVALFCCFTLLRTGSLWFAVGLHASWDWAQSYFYGVPDSGGTSPGHLLRSSSPGPAWLSGGSVGPEGSVLVLAVIAVMFVVFHFAFPERNASQ